MEIESGYAWYKFHVSAWLSSPEVQAMNFHERGVYHHLLTVQSRDGKLASDAGHLAKQCGMDRRTLEKWLRDWGHLVPIIRLSGDVLVTCPLQGRCVHAASSQRPCSVCATEPQRLLCFPAASWMRTGSFRANPKQWNLSVKSGEMPGQPFLEENRGEGYIEGDGEGDRSAVTLTARACEQGYSFKQGAGGQ